MEDYPKTLAELERRFSTEEACREYLFQLRWPDGFRCPVCGHSEAWKLKGGLFRCTACGHKTSVTAGTLFEGTRKPLASWFRVIWWVTSQKNGASALGLQRILGLGSYRTAWTWLHKLRRAMIRLKQIADASAKSLEEAIQEMVERAAVVKTDDWNGYKGLESLGYRHPIVRKSATVGDNLLPLCHRQAALIKRWLIGTHQGAVSHEHLAYYLDEYTFRFNRRTSQYRGKLFYRLLQNAIAVDAIPYQEIAKGVRRQKSENTTPSG